MENIDELFKRAKHQLEIEGFVLNEEYKEKIKAILSGKMTREELINKLKNQ